MTAAEKYRLGAVISFIFLLITLVILFVFIWNKISLNPDMPAGNIIYFLLLIAGILSVTMFLLFLRYLNSLSMKKDESYIRTEQVKQNDDKEKETEGFKTPYEVDLDTMAEKIVSNIDPSASLNDFSEKILINLAHEFGITQGLFYLLNEKKKLFEPVSTYAYASDKAPEAFSPGEGLHGQTAKSRQILSLENLPDDYLNVVSGLGHGKANHLIIIPIVTKKDTIGIIEITTFKSLKEEDQWIFKNLAKIIANAIIAKTKSQESKG